MTAEELIGQLVMVHPELTKDPAGKSGQIGIITGTELENDNIYVGFGRKGQGLYGTDALLLLRPAEQLKDLLQQHKQELSVTDFKAVFQTALLQELVPTTPKLKTAMSLALQSVAVRNMTMRSVEEALGLHRGNYPER